MSTPSPRRNSEAYHESLIFTNTTDDIFDRYEIIQTLGEGSMGAVAKVRIRPEKVGGSAFHPRTTKRASFRLGLFRRDQAVATNTKRTLAVKQDLVFALKSIILDRVSPIFLKELENEIHILKSMDHPNIVKAIEVYRAHKQIYLVLELCDGGDLYTRSPYTERQAGRIVGMFPVLLFILKTRKLV
jgi:serine/threonine protein kinase